MSIRRIIKLAICLSILLVCALESPRIASAQISTAVPAEWYQDAELTDVFFIDADTGWITGENGLLMSSKDGGRSWQQVETNLDCRLESVWFVDSEIGYVVGGYYQPHNHRSVGVILKTVDAGKTWVRDRNLTLPRLRKVHFSDTRTGWALGDGSPMYPVGVFYTHDGGRSWSSLSSKRIASWQDGVLGQDHFLLVSANGRLQRMDLDGEVSRAELAPAEIKFNSLRFASPELVWAVGNEGWIGRSTDGGRTWKGSNEEMDGKLQVFDLSTLCTVGESCWIAGRPGSRIIRTRDGGKNWSALATGQTTPIKKLFFLDENRGWAIGSLGTVLGTDDGGTSWKSLRGRNQHATVLAFFSDYDQVPLEIFSLLAASEGRFCTIELVQRRNPVGVNSPSDEELARLRQALTRIGCSSVEDFMLDGAKSISYSGKELRSYADLTEERLVALIRSWRPALVLTNQSDAAQPKSLAHEFNKKLMQAMEKAGDSEAYPTQLQFSGLRPWKVAKALCVGEHRNWSDATISSAQFSPHLCRTVEDHAFISRQLVHETFALPVEKYSLKQQRTDLPDRYATQGLLSGIPAIIGENARQPQTPTSGNLQSLRFLTKKQEHLSNLLNVQFTSPASEELWRTQLMTSTAGLLPETGGNILFQLAYQYNQTGRPELADKTFRMFLNRYGDHELAESALIWLLQYHASGEVRHGEWGRTQAAKARDVEIAERSTTERSPLDNAPKETELDPQANTSAGEFVENDPRDLGGNVQMTSYAAQFMEPVDHTKEAQTVAAAIKRIRPELGELPQLQFPLAALSRSDPNDAERLQWASKLKNMSQVKSDWSSFANAESWLEQRESGASPLAIAHCVEIPELPKLDGQLDEHFWQAIAESPLSIHLTNDDKGGEQKTNTTIMLAHDQRFIYLAATCEKYADFEHAEERRIRPRDPDLSAFDRLEIKVDIDRDYVSFYELTIDHRGWVSESRFGDRDWNPQWFVASRYSETAWSIEAAIPIEELAQRMPTNSEAWALSIQRQTPNHQTQRWSNAAQSKLSYGLLMFDQ